MILSLAVSAVRAQDDSDHVFDDIDKQAKQSDQHIKKLKRQRAPSDAGVAARQMQVDVDDSQRAQAQDMVRLSADMEAQYKDYAKQQAEQRATYRKMVLQQWNDFRESSRKEWVDYNTRGDSMSDVDFEEGKIKVEVLVPLEEVAPDKKVEKVADLAPEQQDKVKKLAEQKITEQTKKVLSEKADGKTEALEGQVQDPEGKPVTEKNADAFVKEQVAPKMIVEEKPVVAQDGKPRVKVTVEIPLIPNHLRVRAERYAPEVKAYAKENGIDPALVFALIHTESYFNPMAKSNVGALGLMQLVPRTAGLEAYRYLYKQDKLITPAYLYDADNNIKLGTTYVHILETANYGKLKNPDNRTALTIAAYNCGPGNVHKYILSHADPDAVSNEQLLKVIAEHAPKETQAYVPHVEGRIAMYRGL